MAIKKGEVPLFSQHSVGEKLLYSHFSRGGGAAAIKPIFGGKDG